MIIFEPVFTPYQMLELGVFDGEYFDDDDSCLEKKVLIEKRNLFAPDVSQPRQMWVDSGWITPEDPLGWFQWYTRYYHGRRIGDVDLYQIKRWRSFSARHGAQVRKNGNCDLNLRRRQRQCLIHWSADPIPDIDIKDKFEYLIDLKQKGKL